MQKNNLDDKDIKEDDKIDTKKNQNLTESEINEDEEKTGWWS